MQAPIRVDFYLLASNAANKRWDTACRLLEKAYLRRHTVFVFCEHQQDAEYIDEYLWTFKDDSFIPHHLQGEGPEPPPPIQIGYAEEPRGFHDILLNMANNIPPFFHRFQRIFEIIDENPDIKNMGREHYRQYRSKGCQLFTHKLT